MEMPVIRSGVPSRDPPSALMMTNPQNLAYVEAHGTGTPVGDPIEATAIGQGLARDRSSPLPIGSIKTNIGHLEAASGMAGLLKAMLALQHGVVPKSLHFHQPSKNIDFESLNLRVCDRSRQQKLA